MPTEALIPKSHIMRFLSLFIAATFCLLSACSSADTVDRLDEAAEQLSVGEYGKCQQLCDGIMADSTAFTGLSATQLCRLAEMYVSLPDEHDSNDGAAVRCLSRARSLASDSVAAFLSTVDRDKAARLYTLDRVGSYLEVPRDSLVSEEDVLDANWNDSTITDAATAATK